MDLTNLLSDPNNPKFILLMLILVWTMFWKALALWTAAKNNKKVWFVVLLVINTFGILEIIYIFQIAKKTMPEALTLFKKEKEKVEEKKEDK